MKHQIFTFLLVCSTLAMSLLTSCNNHCDNCQQNAECLKGECVCSPGYHLFNNNCYQLEGEGAYMGINSACYCYDTMLVNISGTGEYRSMSMAVKQGNSVGTLTQGIFYYETSTGDSLWSPQFNLRCFNDAGDPIMPAVYGKKRPDGDWLLVLEFQDPFTLEVKDKCNMLLQKL